MLFYSVAFHTTKCYYVACNGYFVTKTIPAMPTKIKLSGVSRAAKEAGVTRQHIYRCCIGTRKPSAKVLDAISSYVTVYEPRKPAAR